MISFTEEQLKILEITNAIYLLLGPACNMTCRHCSQTPIKGSYGLSPEDDLSQDVIDFIKAWSDNKLSESYARIYFWGGEPLLYWNKIKEYILQFESLGINPRNGYRLFSNGLLLNDEIANFCNAHHIAFTMSYDAPNPLAVRNEVPSEENINSFFKIRRRSVNFVYNAINHDMVQAFSMLEALFPNTLISMGVLTDVHGIPEDIYAFEEGQIEQDVDNLADSIVNGNDTYGNRYKFFKEQFIRMDTFRTEKFTEYPWPPCAPGIISYSFKFNGDIVRCHNDNQVICHVTDSLDDIIEAHLTVWKDLLPQKCLTCPAVSMCRNRCPIALKTQDGTEYMQCDYLRKFYVSLIRNRERLTNIDLHFEKFNTQNTQTQNS